MWDLTVSVPDHCLSSYFVNKTFKYYFLPGCTLQGVSIVLNSLISQEWCKEERKVANVTGGTQV